MSAANFQADSANIYGYADIVMKGGIASGIVYPQVLEQLAQRYVFNSIGGTSVGAIAASIAAAAEFRRRQNSNAGYAALSNLATFLARDGTLKALFRPDQPGTALLDIALAMTGTESFWFVKIPSVLLRLGKNYPWIPGVTALLLAFALWSIAGDVTRGKLGFIVIAIVFASLVWLFGSLIYVSAQAIWILNKGEFGLSHGHDKSAENLLAQRLKNNPDITSLAKEETPPLIDWLDAFIGYCAGRAPNDPLTFGDLWDAPAPSWDKDRMCGDHSIDFKMITTCLTLGRPFELPFDPTEKIGRVPEPATDVDANGNPRPELYFKESVLEKYFGANVIAHLKQHGAKSTTHPSYFRFPSARNTPIVVAARLSMSFPILFSAVPLYALDENSVMQEVWFSDGGLSSNFPIHLFDCPMPRWPTFCIDLLGGDPDVARGERHHAKFDKDDQAFLESDEPIEAINSWNKLSRGYARGNVLAFASSIIDAMRTWQDTTLGLLPGNSSRTVAIRIPSDEGGLNLDMTPPLIHDMIQRGGMAASVLLNRFDVRETGWPDQRWLRYRATMGAITEWLGDFSTAYGVPPGLENYVSYDSMIRNYFRGNPSVKTRLASKLLWADEGQAQRAREATKCLSQERKMWPDDCGLEGAPTPKGTLRMRPHV